MQHIENFRVFGIFAALALSACSDQSDKGFEATGTAQALATSGPIVGYYGKCLDARGGIAALGTPVQLYACNGSDAQKWTAINGQLVGVGGLCLDAKDGTSSGAGTLLQLWTCSGGANQQFSVGANRITGIGGNCVDVRGPDTADSTPIQLYSCWGGANQAWTFAAGSGGTGKGGSTFYGANAHWDYSWSPQTIVDHLHQINSLRLRLDVNINDVSTINTVNRIAGTIRAIDPNIKVLAVLGMCGAALCPPSTWHGWNSDATSDTNYGMAYDGARLAAQSLGSVGVADFECGNEMIVDPRVFPAPGAEGDVPHQYGNPIDWAKMRETIRGLRDGVNSVNTSFRKYVNFTSGNVAASDMLWNGQTPNGTDAPYQDATPLRWDVTSWHNYRVNGDPFAFVSRGHGTFSVIQYAHDHYGVPISITEWNGGPEDSDQTKAAWTDQLLRETLANRAALGIESIMIYQMDGGGPDFGLFAFPAQTTAYSLITAANP